MGLQTKHNEHVAHGPGIALQLTHIAKTGIILFLMNPFKVGDRIIYPNQGLGVIEAIQEQAFDGERFVVYCLRVQANNTLIMVPAASAEEMGIRRLISERAVKEIFDFMKKGAIEVSMNWKGRYKEHINLMKSGTIFDMVAVLKSLFYLSRLKPLSFREKKMMEKARDLIVTEISAASAVPLAQIERKITSTLSTCFKDVKPGLDI